MLPKFIALALEEASIKHPIPTLAAADASSNP